jgi:signal transduction histidine kinase
LGQQTDLVVTDDSGAAIVLGDRAQLEHALLYLALNARDAMPNGGRLTIHTALAHASGATDPAPPDVTISVTDTGRGMSDELRAHHL